mmetsp:Transcript_4241/g.6338  ORF Transcript_4241/g.6338 Transcript_4241/m.6338 type:complete len:461 (-) Transcript_4241:365-1747(-)
MASNEFNIPGVNVMNGGQVSVSDSKWKDLVSDINISSVPAPTGPAGFLIISISQPQREGEGMKEYMTYKVSTNTDRPDFEYGQFAVVRRYNDFVWLNKRLAEEFAGAVIPPLPEKSIGDRFKDEFVQARMKALEKFLNRVAAHDELSTSVHFSTFLKADSENLAQAKGAQPKPPVKDNFFSFVSETVTFMQRAVAPLHSEAVKTPADVRFEEISNYITAMEMNIASISRHASNLVRKSQELSTSLNEFGLSFSVLGESVENQQLQTMLGSVGHTSDEISAAFAEQAQQEKVLFESPLFEYMRTIHAIKRALEAREAKKLKYHTAVAEVEGKKGAHTKLLGQPGKEGSVAEAEESVRASFDKAVAAKAEYETVSARVVREVEKFKREKGEEMRKIIMDYVAIQVEYNKRIGDAWNSLLPTLGAGGSEEGGFIMSNIHNVLSGGTDHQAGLSPSSGGRAVGV